LIVEFNLLVIEVVVGVLVVVCVPEGVVGEGVVVTTTMKRACGNKHSYVTGTYLS
jgi:hypothetical protein